MGEGPNSDEPPLTYTVTGVPFPITDNDDEAPTESPTTPPTTAEPTNLPATRPTTAEPTKSPTTPPTTAPPPPPPPTESPTKSKSCADQTAFLWKNKPKRNCQWAGKGSPKKMKKKCKKKNSDGTNVAYYCRQTCATMGLGPCK